MFLYQAKHGVSEAILQHLQQFCCFLSQVVRIWTMWPSPHCCVARGRRRQTTSVPAHQLALRAPQPAHSHAGSPEPG